LSLIALASPFAPWPEKSPSQKEKRKKKENPPPTPFLQKKKEKRKQESEKENRNPEYAQGCSFFLFHRAGRGLAESACPLTSWPPVAIPLKQIV